MPSPAPEPSTKHKTSHNAALQACIVSTAALVVGVGVVLCFVFKHNLVPETSGFVLLLVPYLLLALVAALPGLTTASTRVLAIGLFVVLGFGCLLVVARRGEWGGWGGLSVLLVFILQCCVAILTVIIALCTWAITAKTADEEVAATMWRGRTDLTWRLIALGCLGLLLGCYALFHERMRGEARRAFANYSKDHEGTTKVPAPVEEYLKPAFLTPERLRGNLLANNSFEQEPTTSWAPRSWRMNLAAASVVDDTSKSGTASARLQTTQSDDCMFAQKVAVRPRTRYLLSGWVRTKDVVIVDKLGQFGANLSVWGAFESSRSIVATHDWAYVAVAFNSGERTEVEVGGRLGHHGSVATGTAWFDDLVLIELK